MPVTESVIPPEFVPRGYRLPKGPHCCARCAYCSFDPYNPARIGKCNCEYVSKNWVNVSIKNACKYFVHITTAEEEKITRIHTRRPKQE